MFKYLILKYICQCIFVRYRKKNLILTIRFFILSGIHSIEEIFIVLALTKLVQQKFHTVRHSHLHQNPAQDPHLGKAVFVNQQFFFARSGTSNVNGREQTLVGKFAIKDNFRIAGTFEFFKNNFIHTGAGINQRRGDNRQRTALFNVSAAPSRRLGRCRALASTPPVKTLPDEGITVL